MDTEAYIKIYSAFALQEMERAGVPASITLAQGILESGNGNSRLARVGNNHFGIKCGSSWTGRKTYKDDDRRNECFRVYKNARGSYRDHSDFLHKNRYRFLFDLRITDYKGWARGLKRAGYATNPRYPNLLIDIIERYNLQRFDRMNRKQIGELLADEKSMPVEKTMIPQPKVKIATKTVPKDSIETAQPALATTYRYSVKKGDTLYSIAQRFGLEVEQLKVWNQLSSNSLSIGQKLVVSK